MCRFRQICCWLDKNNRGNEIGGMFLGSISIHRAHLGKLAINDIFSLASSGWLRLSCAYRSRMPVGALFLVAQFIVIRTESTATKATRIRFLTWNSKQKKPFQIFGLTIFQYFDAYPCGFSCGDSKSIYRTTFYCKLGTPSALWDCPCPPLQPFACNNTAEVAEKENPVRTDNSQS